MARLAIAALLPLLCPAPAAAQEGVSPHFHEELRKQESIYRSQGGAVPGGYVVNRGLAKYAGLLPSGFEAALRDLGPGDRWLDVGAGSGQAILDYYAQQDRRRDEIPFEREKARAVAVSIEDRRTGVWAEQAAALGGSRIQYLFGKPLRNYSRDELGRFQLITDVYGGFSYTEELSVFVEKVLDLLELNGSFYSLLQSVRLQDGKDDPTTWYLTELVDASGRDVKVCSWLERIACVEVTCESKSDWDTPTELIRIRKVCDAVSVPALEGLLYEAGQPPGRRFRLKP
jgi:SAM-dependent methyltransferase